MIDGGYRITKDTQFELAFDKPIDNAAAILLLSSEAGGAPNWRVTYSIAQIGENVRAVADLAIVENPGSLREKRVPLSGMGREGSPTRTIQALLDDVRTDLGAQTSESKPHR
jgi:hypothetical protein